MTTLRRWLFGCIGLGGISLLLGLPAHLALTDIARAGGDLAAEWRMVQTAALAAGLFHVAALITFVRVLRDLRAR